MLFDDYPPAAFHFTVALGPLPLILDSSFQEVSGIGSEMLTEPVTEGGENRYTLQLPKGTKHTNLQLKRGIAGIASPLVLWCKSTLEDGLSDGISTKSLYVFLLDELRLPLRMWSFENAYPVKWTVGGFNSQRNEVALETIELAYTISTRKL